MYVHEIISEFGLLVFVWGRKTGEPEAKKNPWRKNENKQQTQPTYEAGNENWTRDTLVGGERSNQLDTIVPQKEITSSYFPWATVRSSEARLLIKKAVFDVQTNTLLCYLDICLANTAYANKAIWANIPIRTQCKNTWSVPSAGRRM